MSTETTLKRINLSLGILTEPDRIAPTEEENRLPFILGEREGTTPRFYVKYPIPDFASGGEAEGVPEGEGLPQQTRQEEFSTASRTTAPCFISKCRGFGLDDEGGLSIDGSWRLRNGTS